MLRTNEALEPPELHALGGVERIVMMYNACSSNFTAAEARVGALLDDQDRLRSHPDISVTYVETSPDPAVTVARVRSVPAGSVIFGICGDGTASTILGSSLVPVLLAGGGNADDLPHMIHGSRYRSELSSIVHNAVLRPLRPLDIDIQPPDAAVRRIKAFGYFTNGFTAQAADRLDQARIRERNLGRWRHMGEEALVCAQAMANIQSFDITTTQGNERYGEIAFLTGNRMAKTTYPRATKIFETGASAAYIRHPNGVAIVGAMAKMAVGFGSHFADYDSFTYTVNQAEPILAQADGEVFSLTEGTTVSVQLSAQTVPVITARAAA
ncbi:MAG: hypothetical protein JWN38_198 [Candidatus Saccharibacteria bacterium]|nr:hypothetical protein [Candidatus Saccharibacteria bacterium]